MADSGMADVAPKSAPTSGAGAPVLSVQNLEAWYGESHILHGINFNVNAGEVVTLLGRNGAGKTTTLKSVMGIIGKRTGSIRFNDQDITRTSSDRIARMGDAGGLAAALDGLNSRSAFWRRRAAHAAARSGAPSALSAVGVH